MIDGLPLRRRGVLEVHRRRRIPRAIRRDHDVIETEREDHRFRDRVLGAAAGLVPVPVRPQALVDVAAVKVDHVIGLLDDLGRDQMRRAIGLRAIRTAGIHPVHVLAVGGIEVRHDLHERRHVEQRHDDHRARQLLRIDAGDQFLERDDRGVFGAVRAGEEREHRSGLGAVRHRNGNRHRRIAAGWNLDGAGRRLPACRFRGANGEHRAITRLRLCPGRYSWMRRQQSRRQYRDARCHHGFLLRSDAAAGPRTPQCRHSSTG